MATYNNNNNNNNNFDSSFRQYSDMPRYVDEDDPTEKYNKCGRKKRRLQNGSTLFRIILSESFLYVGFFLLGGFFIHVLYKHIFPPEATLPLSSGNVIDLDPDAPPLDSELHRHLMEKDGAFYKLVQTYIEHQVDNEIHDDDLEEDVMELLTEVLPHDDAEELMDEIIEGIHHQKRHYADKHFRRLEDIETDPDCMEREFDVEDEEFDIEEATQVFKKCKLLVLKNVFDPSFIEQRLKKMITQYVMSLKSGRTSMDGTTTTGDAYYVSMREGNRWELLLPEDIIRETSSDVLTNDIFMDILKSESVLGDSHIALHSAGVNFAAAGAVGQGWHEDEQYLFDLTSFEASGIAGSDLPSFAVTVSIPLLDMTRQHGPTEFCMGSPAVEGLEIWTPDNRVNEQFLDEFIHDKTLIEEGSSFRRYSRSGRYAECHPDFWRSPVLKLGDVLFFDYQLKHRGSWNTSPDTRAIMFLTYSRFWFKDCNFRQDIIPEEVLDEMDEEDQLAEQLIKYARFALPHGGVVGCRNEEECQREANTDLNSVSGLEKTEQSQSEEVDEETGKLMKGYFVISNKDVYALDGHPRLVLNDEDVGDLPPGSSVTTKAKLGDLFKLVDKGDTLMEWPVHYHGQIVFTADAMEGVQKSPSKTKEKKKKKTTPTKKAHEA